MDADCIFHETYGVYYKAIEKIIIASLDHAITINEAESIVRETAYAESPWLLLKNIQKDQYNPVLDSRLKTVIKHNPKTPVTTLERRWLKTILSDKRVKLFNLDTSILEGVEPLFHESDVYFCGQYDKGDDYMSEEYINNFHTILRALKEGYNLQIEYESAHNHFMNGIITPCELQYSIKEDRFRLFASYSGVLKSFNLSRIMMCQLADKCDNVDMPTLEQSYVEVIMTKERHTVERFLLSFSNYRRSTKKESEDLFKVRITFPKQDEQEVLINILSFTPMVKIEAPSHMVKLMKERVERQRLLYID